MDDVGKQRKREHLKIAIGEDVAHTGTTLLECVQLFPHALPELSLDDIDIRTQLLGKPLAAPLMITSMSGGTEEGARLNRELAEVSGKLGIAFSVGSQRVMLNDLSARGDFDVRRYLGDNGVLLGNIGAQQLLDYPAAQIKELAASIDSDGLCVHLNPSHELAQDGGARDFRGIVSALELLATEMPGRLIVKETGAGLGPAVVKTLAQLDLAAIDVAGAGGTSFTKVEQYRGHDPLARRIAQTFADWGLPTAYATILAQQMIGVTSSIQLIASGGITTGLDTAKAIACGADMVGIAGPVLLAWHEHGAAGARLFLEQLVHELRTAMLLVASGNLESLKTTSRVYTNKLCEMLAGDTGQGIEDTDE